MAEELLVTGVDSRSSGVEGRSLNSARTNHFIVDEPAYNGGPGEALTPAEVFLSGVSSCGVLLVEAFARKDGVSLKGVSCHVDGIRTKENPADFQKVTVAFEIRGVDTTTGEGLVEKYKAR